MRYHAPSQLVFDHAHACQIAPFSPSPSLYGWRALEESHREWPLSTPRKATSVGRPWSSSPHASWSTPGDSAEDFHKTPPPTPTISFLYKYAAPCNQPSPSPTRSQVRSFFPSYHTIPISRSRSLWSQVRRQVCRSCWPVSRIDTWGGVTRSGRYIQFCIVGEGCVRSTREKLLNRRLAEET